MKKLGAVLSILCVVFAVTAIEVDTAELETVSDTDIVFSDYTGPVSVINTRTQIQGIGIDLGKAIASGTNSAGTLSRYYVIHALDSAEKNGLDADIFILGDGAAVDQIRNLRWIIGAYLMEMYDYSVQDAQTLANFITVYNAVYRGKLATYQTKYKPIVVKNLVQDKVGLSTNYIDWAGKTQIVIPLSDPALAGTVSAIDTAVISDKTVIDSLRAEDGKGITDRKDLVDLKERESDAAQQRAAEAQKTATDAQKSAEVQKTRLADEQAALIQKQAEAEKAKGTVQEAQKQEEVQQQTEKVAEQKEAVVKAEEKVQQTAVQAKQEQTLADKKQNEAQADRIEIAKDQQEVIKEQAAARENPPEGKTALIISDPQNLLSSLVLVDSKTAAVLKESALNSIRERTLLAAGTNYIAIAGKSTGSGVIKLVLIDGKTLDVISQSEETLPANAMLISLLSSYYTVVQSGSDCVIARYNEKLEMQGKSSLAVLPETAITVSSANLIVQAKNNEIRILRASDLTDITEK